MLFQDNGISRADFDKLHVKRNRFLKNSHHLRSVKNLDGHAECHSFFMPSCYYSVPTQCYFEAHHLFILSSPLFFLFIIPFHSPLVLSHSFLPLPPASAFAYEKGNKAITTISIEKSSSSADSDINDGDNNYNNNNNMTTRTPSPPPSSSSSSSDGIASKLARANILELQPYRCARDDYSEGVLLDANENAFGPTSLPSNSLDPYDNSNTLERYPDPYQKQLKDAFCRERGHDLQPSNVFVGVGSDEAIDLLMRIFCTPGSDISGDNILITPPTYGMYKVCAKVNDVRIISVPLTSDFDLNVPKVRRHVLLNSCCCCSHSFIIHRFYILL